MKQTKTIVITGGNRGIGKGIITSIIKENLNFNKILLCSRQFENGEKAKDEIKSEFGKEISNKIDVIKLDIDSESDVTSFVKTLKNQYDHINCLINNAGIKIDDSEVTADVFNKTMTTNFYSTLNFTETLLENQLLPQRSKIIFISSSVGKVNIFKNKDLARRFLSKDLTVKDLNQLSNEYKESIMNKTISSDGWPVNVYYYSKYVLNKYSSILSRREDIINKEIQVYSNCPGWVKTRMGGEKASRSITDGVKGVLYLINKEDRIDSLYQGGLVFDGKVVNIDRV